ncbi:MAG: hypothetical protein J7L03_00590 [Caldisericaceae bacterium]|nr:hypothetical protein [Caldisericaceae bacterium]
MKKFFAIVKASFLSMITVAKRKRYRSVTIFGALGAMALSLYFLTKLAVFLYGIKLPANFQSVNIPAIVLNGVIIMALLYLFLASLSLTLSNLYLSSDNTLLMSMPVKEEVIFSARFVFMVFEEALFLIGLVYPFFLGYGIRFHLNVLYYVLSFVFVIFLPVIPFALSLFVLIPLAEKLSAKKLYNVVLVLNAVFAILLYLATQIANPSYGIFKFEKNSGFIKSFDKFLRFSPSNIGYIFAESFGKGHPLLGIAVLIGFIAMSLLLFYLCVLFAKNRYETGLTNASRTESVKIEYKENRMFNVLPVRVRALVSKDLKILFRDVHIKTMFFMNIAYIVFFLFVFVVMPAKGGSEQLNLQLFLMPALFYVIADSMVCLQNSAILFFADRESVWVVLMSKVRASEFFWSKFVLPFAIGESVNILLFFVSFILTKGSSDVIFLSLPFVLFLPLFLTTAGITASAMFPAFKTPENPKKLVSGKTAIANFVTELLATAGVLGVSFLSMHLYKIKGFGFTFLLAFLIVGIVSVAVSFPLIALAISKIKNFELV